MQHLLSEDGVPEVPHQQMAVSKVPFHRN